MRPELLDGRYAVVVKGRLQANEELTRKVIWSCSSFEQLTAAASAPVNTIWTGRRITWRTEVRWALKQGRIVKETE